MSQADCPENEQKNDDFRDQIFVQETISSTKSWQNAVDELKTSFYNDAAFFSK
jgi:hypothetical protein